MSGYANCFMCEGRGYVPTQRTGPGTSVSDDGQIIEPCVLCVAKDKSLYGTAFVKKGVRIDPGGVSA